VERDRTGLGGETAVAHGLIRNVRRAGGRLLDQVLPGWRGWLAGPPVPVNLSALPTDPDTIARHASGAVDVGLSYLDKLRRYCGWQPDAGGDVLELGPGPGFGAAMTLACHGLRPSVSDRWLTPWDSAYHTAYYTSVVEQLEARMPGTDTSCLRTLVAAGGYDPQLIGQLPDASALDGVADGWFDVVVSNAVFEHVLDAGAVTRHLARITRPGGWGIHQIDLRDHSDFDRPLEYLLLTEGGVGPWLRKTGTHMGHPRRLGAYVTAFSEAGFEIVHRFASGAIDAAYLADFVPRLRAAVGSPWRHIEGDDLVTTDVCLVVRRPPVGEAGA
jgi:SAM-dependent methyltransferase